MSAGVRRRKARAVDVKEELEETQDAGLTISWSKAVCISLVAAVCLLPVLLWFIPSPIEPQPFILDDPPAFEGPLTPNTHLQQAERLYENKVWGPESMVLDGEYMYTGTYDGKIVEIYKGEIRVMAQLGRPPCGGFEYEPTCGRPLGMKMDNDGFLIVADCYLGLFKINVATGDVFLLWPLTAAINGKRARLLNDIAIAKDGTIYLTDSSTRWDRRHFPYLVAEGETSGRLLAYNPSTNTSEELYSGIAFANGITLSRGQDFLLICETTKARILKYNLKGPKAGQMEVLTPNLPGMPDNIRPSSSGGYWIGFASVRLHGVFSLAEYSSDKPWLRKLFAKLVPQEYFKKFTPKYGLVIEINNKGEILRSLHDPSGQIVPAVSEVEDKNGVLYLGSYELPYLSRLFLARLKS